MYVSVDGFQPDNPHNPQRKQKLEREYKLKLFQHPTVSWAKVMIGFSQTTEGEIGHGKGDYDR